MHQKVKQQQQTKNKKANIIFLVRPGYRTRNHWQHRLMYYLSATDPTQRIG